MGQKVVAVLPMQHASFIVEELRGVAVDMARHRFGCRVLCRLLEHFATDKATTELIDEVLTEVDELSRHSFGHHVIEHILEHGREEDQRRVLAAIQRDLVGLAMDRHASHVVEKALRGPEVERDRLAHLLRSDPSTITALGQSPFGRFVVRSLAEISGKQYSHKAEGLGAVELNKHGKRLLEDISIGSAMP